MSHFRYNIKDWPEAVAMLPMGACVKAVDNVQMLSEAKSVNKHVITNLRHYTGSQQPGATYEANLALVKEFQNTFLDETFWKGETKGVPHRHVDYIEDWNEYGWFISQDPETRRRFRLWAIAYLDYWYEFVFPGLDYPINIMIANIPVGNDLDYEVAKRVAHWTDYSKNMIPRVGYHSYWPTRDGVTPYPGFDNDDNWWVYYAGRILEQDRELLKKGIVINYGLTEAGPIGYNGVWPHDVHLIDVGGWREGYVCGGDMDKYNAGLDKFMARLTAWNKANGNRCLTPNLYDSSQAFDQWKSFQLWTPDLKKAYGTFAKYLGNTGVPDPNWENPYANVPEPSPTPPPVPEPDDSPAFGIDVSRWQGVMDWGKAVTAGVDFALIKASEGHAWQDPQFARNWDQSEEVGILRAPYHFFIPELDPLKQANWFVAVVKSTGLETDFPYIADVEKAPASITSITFRKNLQLFLNRVAELTGLKPLIYTSPGFYGRYMAQDAGKWTELADLWVAHWYVGKPYVPPEWAGYVFWQTGVFHDGYKFGAQSERIDHNVFNGDYRRLLVYAGATEIKPVTFYKLTTDANARTKPFYSMGESGKYTKVVTLPKGTVVELEHIEQGETYNGSADWAKVKAWVSVNDNEEDEAATSLYIHFSLLAPALDN